MKFAKYLPDYGIRPHVYALDPSDYPKIFSKVNVDESMLHDLNKVDLVINKVKIDPLSKLDTSKFKKFVRIYFSLYRGSEYLLWRDHLMQQIKKDAATKDFKAVLVTAPPFGMIALGYEIAKKFNIPLILDMRDAWALWNTSPYGSYLHYLATVKKEKKYFEFASRVIATSDQTIADWLNLHPSLPAGKFTCITNGYDRAALEVDFSPFELRPINGNRIFKIVYVGSFYYSPAARKEMLEPVYKKKGHRIFQYYPRKQDWLYRSPYFFFKTIQRVLELMPELRQKLLIEFAGNPQAWMDEMIKEAGLTDIVSQIGFVSHKESLALQKNADALLITSAKVEGGRDCFIAGKTFEYLTMNKPILAFVSEGSQKDILVQSGLSVMFNPDDIEHSAKTFISLLSEGHHFIPDSQFLNRFDRNHLTQELSEVIKDSIIEHQAVL
nr:glycosyltransferase [Flavihumibacter fluvii]